MRLFYSMTLVLVCVFLSLFADEAFSIEIPDPMKETVGYGYTEDQVTVRYADGEVFTSSMEEMGIREFYVFTKNLSRPKGAPPIVLPKKFIVVKTVLETTGGNVNVISTTSGVVVEGSLTEVKTEVIEEEVTGE